jgi:predicted amidophosphoribosyltransferase
VGSLDSLLGLLAPPLCAACGRIGAGDSVLCRPCSRRLGAAGEPLRGRGPDGLDAVWSAAAHEGVARDLVVALKFRRLLPVAATMAELIARRVPRSLLGGAMVPVPTARSRSFVRGFDPAGEIATALARQLEAPAPVPTLRRRGRGRQVGRGRGQRLGDPPRIEAVGQAPASVVLIDDVLTTGATVSACARALREAGAARIVAVTFARRL